MSLCAPGRLDDGAVWVDDEAWANRLYNKGFLGTPQTGNTLRLSLVEAAYAVDQGRLDVDGAVVTDLLGAADGADVGFLAYQDLRSRGLVVRPADDDGAYHVWRRGEGPPSEPWFTTLALSERTPAVAGEVARREGVVSLVDEDGIVTHYDGQIVSPSGSAGGQPHPEGTGVLVHDRVFVPPGPLAASLARAFIGTPQADGRVLSLTEAAHLARQGVLAVDAGLEEHAAARQHHFGRTLPVYEDLRRRGVLARSGFRFGTHLRGYQTRPEGSHAQWLIQCALPEDVMHWSELSRAVRLAHGVRKQFLVAVAGERVSYLHLAWFRP